MVAPLVSIVLPIRNEEAYIRRCLEAVLGQDYPAGRMEILVVDGMSTDATRTIVAEFARADGRIRLIDNPKQIVTSAINIGIRNARGEIVVRVDGHAVIDRDYVSECVRALDDTGADNVGGPMRSKGLGFWGDAVARAMASPFGRPAKYHHATEMMETDTVFLGAFRRTVFDRVGLFDESLPVNEDYELNYRIRRSGGKVVFVPTIRWDYYNRSTLAGLFRQYFKYGKGKAVVVRRNPTSTKPRHLVAPAFVLALTGALALALTGRWQPLAALLGLYGLASAVFTRGASKGAGLLKASSVALCFAAMQIGWGLGFWLSLVRPEPHGAREVIALGTEREEEAA